MYIFLHHATFNGKASLTLIKNDIYEDEVKRSKNINKSKAYDIKS